MSDYKLTFKLKQHTPIIHFQHDQHGATLRSSELKPKLDKYILMKLSEEDKTIEGNLTLYEKGYQIAKAKKWLVGKGEHPALNYKIKIEQKPEVEHYLPLPFVAENKKEGIVEFVKNTTGVEVSILSPSPFFANADKIKFKRGSINFEESKLEELRFGVMTKQNLIGTLFTSNIELKEQLKKHIVAFFILNNFGTRQNKGFGSYSIVELEGEEIGIEKKLFGETFLYKTFSRVDNMNNIFGFILDEYQLLKSGKNFPTYKKSELFEYFVRENIRWEKRFIKQFIDNHKILNKELYWSRKNAPIDYDEKNGTDYNEWEDRQKNDYKYIRALLGLAEQFEYRVFAERKDGDGNWVKTDDVDRSNMYVVSLKHLPHRENEKIERFQSPIFFKVIDGIIYLGINETYDSILGEWFEFYLKFKGDRKGTEKNMGKIRVPEKFDLKDFITKHISENWRQM